MSEFDGQKPRYEFDAADPTPQVDAQEPQYPFDATAPSEVQETGTILVDGFEDGDIGEYGDATGDDLSNFATQQTTVADGSVALEGTTAGTGQKIHSTGGLPAYPAQGDTFRCALYTASTDLTWGCRFGVQDKDNLYLARPRTDTNDLQLYVRAAGSWTLLTEAAVTVPTSEWLTLEVAWGSDGTIVVTLLDSAGSQLRQISATDTTHTSGGIGWSLNTTASTTQAAYYDHLRIV